MSPDQPLTEGQADTRLDAVSLERGTVEPALAARFPGLRVLTPRPAWAASQLSLRAAPHPGAAQVTEALHGEALEVLEELPGGGWAWVRTLHDRYLGYIHQHDLESLSTQAPAQPLTVQVPRAHLYAERSVQAMVLDRVGQGAVLDALEVGPVHHGDYAWWRVRHGGGEAYLHAAATQAQGADLTAFVAASLHAPYLWGGRSAWGLDCSGLAQLWAGRDEHGRSVLPRDADQQQAAAPPTLSPEAGDLAFFPGHVGVMLDQGRMLHANATRMAVSIETLGEGEYGRRLQAALTGFGRVPGRTAGRA